MMSGHSKFGMAFFGVMTGHSNCRHSKSRVKNFGNGPPILSFQSVTIFVFAFQENQSKLAKITKNQNAIKVIRFLIIKVIN